MNNQALNETIQYSDEELIKQFPGFTNNYATVNGIKLHYADGGKGTPLICLPGWPQTWYSYHAIAMDLAQAYRVIIVDIRGMGSSEKPATGYDKKTMATDIMGLVQALGLEKIHLMGHDIGGMVAMSFAFNFPGFVEKLIVLDGAHPSEGMLQMPLLPAAGMFTAKMSGDAPYAWWMGFNQVKDLPEKLLEGRFQYLLEWLFQYVMIDAGKMSDFERSVYASAYNDAESIRAANGWYQAFTQDIEDLKTCPQLTMPVLGIASYVSYGFMKMGMPYLAKDVLIKGIMDSGHYLFEEQPGKVVEEVSGFLATAKH